MGASHALAQFLKRVRDETWNRFHTGKFDYKRDMGNLHKFLKMAQEIGEIGLIVEFHLTISGMEHELGKFQFAENSYHTLLGLVEPHDHWRIGVIYNNLAEIYLWQRNFPKATSTYHQSLDHLQQLDKTTLDTAITSANLGLVYLAQQKYTEAEHWFRKTLEIAFEDSRTYIEALIQSYTGLADMYLQQKENEKALNHIKLAEEWAVEGDLNVDKMEVFLVYAKLAHQCPTLVENKAPHYYELAKSAVTTPGRRYMVAKVLLAEADYHHAIKDALKAQPLALEAQEIFAEFELTEYANLAQRLIASLSGRSSAPGDEKIDAVKRVDG